MKRITLTVITALLLAGYSLAQDAKTQENRSTPQSSSQPAAAAQKSEGPVKPAPGSVIPAVLTKSIDAKKIKTGEEVTAKVTDDLKNKSGEILVPKDTKLIGHVTEAQPRTKEQKESEVGIAFERAVLKDGTEMQLPMSIQAIVGRENQANNANAPDGSQPAYPQGGGYSGGGARGGMGGGMERQQAPPSAPTGGNEQPSATSTFPKITIQTQGVIGISNLKLTSADSTHGSVVSSDKNNVKLDSGTLLLLKVSS